jgi:hypothetical protein
MTHGYRYFDDTGRWLNEYFLWRLMAITLGGEVYSFGISFDGIRLDSFGFDTMALMVMLHHYLAGTFDYDFMVDYDLMTWIQ